MTEAYKILAASAADRTCSHLRCSECKNDVYRTGTCPTAIFDEKTNDEVADALIKLFRDDLKDVYGNYDILVDELAALMDGESK